MTGTNKAQAPARARGTAVTVIAAVMAAAAAVGAAASAETVVVNDQVTLRDSDIARPARGMSMKGVESKFGAPQERHPAVGKPPITRWDYQGFAVFFENDHVIHAVVTPAS
jgi:hypothetical protein